MSTAENPVIIQGVPLKPGQAPGLRHEFSTWATTTPETSIQVSLFIRGLQRLYNVSYTETLSYFQIAGIHGFPGNLPWNGAAPPPYASDEAPNKMIYCTHNMETFPTWHRPYMILFEQTVYYHMVKAINEDLEFHSDTEKQEWLKEASNWRLPYWDWALPTLKGEMPQLFQTANVSIRKPKTADGSQPAPESVSNPLNRYQLKVDGKLTRMGDLPEKYQVIDVPATKDNSALPWSQCYGTSRWGIQAAKYPTDPIPEDAAEGINKFDAVAKAINTHPWYVEIGKPNDDLTNRPICDLVHRLLTSVHEFEHFSTTGTKTTVPNGNVDWKKWVSLEYIHNNLHLWIGGPDITTGLGHMSDVPVAAFDPVFYMHHCNIDRLLAVWASLNPKSWIVESTATDLTPFRHNSPEGKPVYLNSQDGEDDEAYIQRIQKYVDDTYPENTGKVLLQDPSNLLGRDLNKASDHTFDDYLIDVLYDRYALNGDSYTIYFFLGAGPGAEITTNQEATIETYVQNSSWQLVGTVFNFSTPLGVAGAPTCGNCAKQKEAGTLSTALVPLTVPLYEAAASSEVSGIQNLDDDHRIENYLKENLSWVAVSRSGKVVPWSRLGKTKIFVVKGSAQHYRTNGHLSTYGGYEAMSAVTDGKAAGASHDEY